MQTFSPKKSKAVKITIIAIIVVMLASAICIGGYAIYSIFFSRAEGDPNFPSPVVGNDANAVQYKLAAEHGATRTVCIKGRTNGLIDIQTFWSGFLISEDGYIVTSYSRAIGGGGIRFMNFTDYLITLLNKDGTPTNYYATATTFFNRTTDILLLKIKDAPIGTKFDYFEVAESNTVTFGTPALIMGDPVNYGLFAHSATIGNPSILYKDGAGLNNYLDTPVMLINGAVNVGSKGSPLINGDGKIVGMILSRYIMTNDKFANDTVMDVGFAAKSDDILSLIALFKENV